MSKPKQRTTFNIDVQKKMKIERLAIEVSYKTGKNITWTDIMNYLVDNYAEEAAKDIEHSTKTNLNSKKA